MYTQQEIEDAGLGDFRVFLIQVWAYLGLPDPTPVQLDIAYWLQHGPRREILQAFRGVGKSWITVAFVLWHLLLDPEKKIMVVSASQQLADDFSKFCKQLIHGMPLLQHLAPRDGQRDSAISFDVGPATPSKDPSVKSVGITGQLTGSRADIIVPDDIEVPKNSYTHLLRERLAELVKEFDAVLKPGGRVVYLGTPQIEASLYRRLEGREYVTRIWPAEIPHDVSKYAGRLAPFIERLIAKGATVGQPVDPKRFSEADLAERRASYGVAGYALQFMLDTTPSDLDRHPLKLADLMVMDVDADLAPVKLVWGRNREAVIQDLFPGGFDGDVYYNPAYRSPEMARFNGTVMAIDPSGRGADETAYAIVKFLHGALYLVACGGYKDGFAEATLKALAGKALRWGVNSIIIEENYGGGMFNALLKPHLISVGLEKQHNEKLPDRPPAGKIDEEWKGGWSQTQKELRIINTLEPVLASHRLVVNRSVIEEDLRVQEESPAYSLVYQMTRIARIKGALAHDDRLDAVAMACSYWTERMDKDKDRALATHRQDLLDEELKRFMKAATGQKESRTRSPSRITTYNWRG